MPMTLEQALAFKLPDGKTLGEASPEDWDEAIEFWRREVERVADLDPAARTADDRQRMQASIDRHRDFREAASVILEHLRRRDFNA